MKLSALLCLFGIGLLVSCKRKEKAASPASVSPPIPQSDRTLPGVARAAAAAQRVTPALQRDLEASGLQWGDPVFLRAFKEERELEFFVRNRASGSYDLFRTYPIAAASGVLGPKLQEGDRQVPEGFYSVASSSLNPSSRYHLAFNVGYPNAYDQAHARTGSAIMIHGNSVSIGCLAMTDEKIEEIYTLCDAALRAGQKEISVHLFPFRMTAKRVAAEARSPHFRFWKNLAEGYQRFEQDRIPPEVSVEAGTYRFKAGK